MPTLTYYWNLLLVGPLESGLRFLATDMGLGAGLAIILFTLIIRLVLMPLTLQQIRSSKAMARLQPEIKALQKKHGKDREKIQIETMALYKEYGVNPAASCLPLLLQMPVLFALYAALSNLGGNDETFQAPWLWVARLDQPDVINLATVTLPGILPVLAAATQWVQQKMMMTPTDDPQQKLQGQMMQFMPLMMLWFGLSFSSGLALYWVTQNLFGIGQQYFSTGWGSLLPNRSGADASIVGIDPRVSGSSGTTGSSGRGDGRSPRDPALTEPLKPVVRTGARTSPRGTQRDGGGRARSLDGAGNSAKGNGRRPSGRR